VQPRVDGAECVTSAWFTPDAALAAQRAGELLSSSRPSSTSSSSRRFGSADALLAFARGREVVAVEPRVVMSGEQARIRAARRAGYEEAPATP